MTIAEAYTRGLSNEAVLAKISRALHRAWLRVTADLKLARSYSHFAHLVPSLLRKQALLARDVDRVAHQIVQLASMK